LANGCPPCKNLRNDPYAANYKSNKGTVKENRADGIELVSVVRTLLLIRNANLASQEIVIKAKLFF